MKCCIKTDVSYLLSFILLSEFGESNSKKCKKQRLACILRSFVGNGLYCFCSASFYFSPKFVFLCFDLYLFIC